MEKSSLSELFALRKNEDFLALWKNLKNEYMKIYINFCSDNVHLGHQF